MKKKIKELIQQNEAVIASSRSLMDRVKAEGALAALRIVQADLAEAIQAIDTAQYLVSHDYAENAFREGLESAVHILEGGAE